MNFDSYIVQNVEIAQTVPLNCPALLRQELTSNKGLGLFRRCKKRAFTLAETLITLTIIGVVAAMTIPTLVSKYQKHTYVTGLKKAYSTLSNAMALAMHDDEVWEYYSNGGIDWYTSRENIIKKYMKVVKSCDSSNWAECIDMNSLQSNTGIFVTADGMTWTSYITVDINGKKGPNKYGRDIFVFRSAEYNRNGVAQGTVIPRGSKLDAKYLYNTESEYWNNNPSSPRCDSTRINEYCTGRVLEEGEMNY